MKILNFLRSIFSGNTIGSHSLPDELARAQNETQETITSQVLPTNGAAIQHFTNSKQERVIDKEASEYINKDCTSLDTFIISDNINYPDLQKLAQLNGIRLEIAGGWFYLLKRLVIELDGAGWDRRVSCIKEKFAELRFHTDMDYNTITDRYTNESKYTCEICGDRSKIRSINGWNSGACRKHYVKSRGLVILTLDGFILNGNEHCWKDVLSVHFEGSRNYYHDYHTLKISFENSVKFYLTGDIPANYVFVYSNNYGWGALLASIPTGFANFDYDYAGKYKTSSACKICGYIAVYNNSCECCEERIWDEKEFSYFSEEEYISSYQLEWYDDEGDQLQEQTDLYPKWPGYVKLVTDEMVIKYREEMMDHDADE